MMIVVGSLLAFVVVSVVVLGVSARSNSFHLNRSEIAFIKTEGCAEEALIRLSRDEDYVGGSYNIDSLDCVVAVTGGDEERNIDITASEDEFFHHFVLNVQLTPVFAILNFTY